MIAQCRKAKRAVVSSLSSIPDLDIAEAKVYFSLVDDHHHACQTIHCNSIDKSPPKAYEDQFKAI